MTANFIRHVGHLSRPLTTAALFALTAAALGADEPKPASKVPPVGSLVEPANDLPKGAIARIGSTWLRDKGLVNVVAFSADGKRMAWGTERVQICDAATGKPQLEFRPAHELHFIATELAFSPDGRMLAAGGYWSKTVWIWDLDTRKLLHAIPNAVAGQESWSFEYQGPGFAFTPDSRTLIVGGKDGGLHLWDAASGKELAALSESKEPVFSLTLTADGRTALTAHRAGELHVWDVANAKHLRKLTAKVKYPQLSALAPDGKTIAFASSATEIDLCDPDGERRHRLTAPAAIVGLGFAPDGSTLRLADDRGTVTDWDVRTGKTVKTVTCERLRPRIGRDRDADKTGPRVEAWFRPDGKMMAWANLSTLQPWDLANGKETPKITGSRQGMAWAGFSADGRSVYAGGSFGEIGIWDAATGIPRGPIQTIGVSQYLMGRFVPSADRQRVVVTGSVLSDADPRSWPSRVLLWDLTGKAPPVSFCDLAGFDHGAAPTPDRRSVVVAATEQIRVYEAATGALTRSFPGRKYERTPVFSPDSARLATLGGDKLSVRVYDFATGRVQREFGAFSHFVVGLVFAPDGKTIASGHSGSSSPPGREEGEDFICLWDVASGRELRRFQIGHRHIAHLAYSADGRMIAICGHLGAVCLWETSSGQERRNFEGHRNWVDCVDFAPDGRRIVSASADGTAVVWRVFDSPPSDVDVAAAWADLAKPGAPAHRAIGDLIAAKGTAAFLGERLKPAVAPSEEKVARWIGDLASQKFADREAAQKELAALGELAEPALVRGLKAATQAEARKRITALLETVPHTEKRPDQLRDLRAVEVLEHIGTVEARRVLERLGAGFANARLTQDAKASLDRMNRRR